MIRDDFMRLVGRRFNLDYTTASGDDYYDMIRSFNEGIREAQKRVPLGKSQVTFTPGNVSKSDVRAQNWVYILEIQRAGDGLPLLHVGKRDIDYLQRNNVVSTPSGSGTTYYAYDQGWLHFWPTPATTDQFLLDVVAVSTDGIASADPKDTSTNYGMIPLEHQGLVLEWMLKRAAEFLGDLQKAQYHDQQFEKAVEISRAVAFKRGGRQGRVPVVGYPQSNYPGRRNDTYPF